MRACGTRSGDGQSAGWDLHRFAVEQVVNDRTAKALALSVPQSLVANADHVID